MNPRTTFVLLALSLSACSRDSLENLATNTRDRAQTASSEVRNLPTFEERPPAAGDYLISRRPSDAPIVPTPAPAGDTLSNEPNSPFSPSVTTEPTAPASTAAGSQAPASAPLPK